MAKTWGLLLRNIKEAWHGDRDLQSQLLQMPKQKIPSSLRPVWKPKKFSRKKTKQNKQQKKKGRRKRNKPTNMS